MCNSRNQFYTKTFNIFIEADEFVLSDWDEWDFEESSDSETEDSVENVLPENQNDDTHKTGKLRNW